MEFLRTTLSAATAIALTATASAKPVTLSAETNLRAAPGTKSEIITLIPQGSEIDVGECDAGWCKVKFGDKEGFAIGRNLGQGAPQTATAGTPRGQSRADLDRLRRGYEQYFDDDPQNDRTGSVQTPPRYSQNQNRRPIYDNNNPDDDFDDDDDFPVVYGRPYVPGPPSAYYGYGPRPRVYYDSRGYYYRRW